MAMSTTMPAVLLAKQRYGNRTITLEQHCTETADAAVRLFQEKHRWGRAWRRFFKLHPERHARFLLNLQVACLFHDIGKANAEFLAMVNHKAVQQTLRHEHISALVLHLPAIRRWLQGNPELDLEVITAAVLSHHLKAAESGDWKWCQPRTSLPITLYLQHAEVLQILERIAAIAGLPPAPALPPQPWSEKAPWLEAWRLGDMAAKRLQLSLGRVKEDQEVHERRRLLLAVKAGLMCADSAASALEREGRSFDWINQAADDAAVTGDEIAFKIIEPRMKQVAAEKGKPFELHQFQKLAGKQGPRALLRAACGMGKTLAAWKWAEAQARGREIGRVIFLYPTRGTATEGFRDYVAWAPESDAALMSGTAQYELDQIFDNPAEKEPAAHGKNFRLSEADERLFALGYWKRRFFSATVDQFLSFMEHRYGSLCLLPVLADSAVIIDEVHSFDRNTFNNLLAFLEAFDVPVLCMTATLPPDRLKQLTALGLVDFPGDADRADLADLEREETAPRYQISSGVSEGHVRSRVLERFQHDERALWVVNTVKRCQLHTIDLLRTLPAGSRVHCYHSRFRLKDRQRIHAMVVGDFKQSTLPAIGVTTQVCEMSLDLDADLLATEYAPVTSLVQRFGRSNRNRHRPGRTESYRAEVLCYPPEKVQPYRKEDIASAMQMLEHASKGDLSQRSLAELLERFAPAEAAHDGSARFLDSGYYATPGSLRDIDEFTEACVLDADQGKVVDAIKNKKPYDAWLLQVPKQSLLDESMKDPKLPTWLKLAPATRYHPRLGFLADEIDLEMVKGLA